MIPPINMPDFSIFERLDELIVKATCVPRRNRVVRLGTKQDFLNLLEKLLTKQERIKGGDKCG